MPSFQSLEWALQNESHMLIYLTSYFINDIDEIRSIEDSDYYFKYFLTKNTRWNERQRFASNGQFVPFLPLPSSLCPNLPQMP